jgi:DNA-binding transcriptional LysR family regulator
MDLRSLEYFLAVADERSFTRAAARCQVTQPTISAQIQALERELGEPLFDRLPREITLSAGGRLLMPYARQCLTAAEDAKAEFSARAGLLRGELRLGTVSGVERTIVPTLLGAFHTRYPAIDVELIEGTSAALLEMVLQGRLNVAVIARPPQQLPATISTETMLNDQLVVVFDPSAFPLDGDPVPLSEIVAHPIITYAATSGLRATLDAAFARAELPLHVNYAANDVRLQIAVAQQRVGVALCAGSDPALLAAPQLARRAVTPPIEYEKVVIWRNDVTSCAPLRAFLQLWTELRTRAAGPS